MGGPIGHAIRLRALPNTPHTSPAIKDRAPREWPDPSQLRLTLPHSHRAKRPISRTGSAGRAIGVVMDPSETRNTGGRDGTNEIDLRSRRRSGSGPSSRVLLG